MEQFIEIDPYERSVTMRKASLPVEHDDKSIQRLAEILDIPVSKWILFSQLVHENRMDTPIPGASKLGVISIQEQTKHRPRVILYVRDDLPSSSFN